MNVFLVLSPLQVLNALEAKAYFGTKDNVLVVLRHTSSGYPVSMFRRLIDETDWQGVYYLATYGEERVGRVSKYAWALLSWQQQRRLQRLAASLGPVDCLFVGSYLEPLVRHFSNTLPHDNLYILDSGTDTLMVNKVRSQRANLLDFSRMSLLSKVLGVRDRQAEQATFFSVFDVDVGAQDTLVPNRYDYFRARNAAVPVGNEVWFLGGPLVLDGYVSEAVYLRHLEATYRFYAGKRFVYVPHSREPEADVERVRERLGCEVKRPGLPVEVAIGTANPRPGEIASFITTALTSCHAMFGATLQVTAVYVDPELFPKYHAFVRDIYRQFYGEADAQFRVLTLEQLEGAS